MVAIPQGWFSMGSDAGRDDERPVHRVWVDSFEMAASASHARRIRSLPRRYRTARASLLERRAVPESRAARRGNLLARCSGVLRLVEQYLRPALSSANRSGVGARGARRRRERALSLGRRTAGKASRLRHALARWSRARRVARTERLRTLPHRATTSTSGVPTGTIRAITKSRPRATRKGRRAAAAKPRAAVPGATTSKSRAARPARASLLNSSTPTTAFASPANRFMAIARRRIRLPPQVVTRVTRTQSSAH